MFSVEILRQKLGFAPIGNFTLLFGCGGYLDVPGTEVIGSMVIGSTGLFHLLINGVIILGLKPTY